MIRKVESALLLCGRLVRGSPLRHHRLFGDDGWFSELVGKREHVALAKDIVMALLDMFAMVPVLVRLAGWRKHQDVAVQLLRIHGSTNSS